MRRNTRFGIPESVRSDNGPQFRSGFELFAKEFDFSHDTSSPHFAQSNGRVERAIQTAKNIIKKSKDISTALLAYHSTPLEDGFSPAELLFSRKIRFSVPIIPNQLGTFINHKVVVLKEKEKKEKESLSYNKRHRSRNLSSLSIDDSVWVTDLRIYGKIVKIDDHPNSYWIKTSKSVIRRNRWHLIPASYKNFETSVDFDPPIDIVMDTVNEQETSNVNSREIQIIPDVPIPNNVDPHVDDVDNDVPKLPKRAYRPVREKKRPEWMCDYTM